MPRLVMNPETHLIQAIKIRAGAHGCALFRNVVGVFQTVQGQWIKAGLGPGSSDTIGWTRVKVTPAMVGKTVAVFTALEVKTPGTWTEPKRLEAQKKFVDAVARDGGIAAFVDGPDQAEVAIRGFRGS